MNEELERFSEWDVRKRYIKGKPRYGCIIFGMLGREFRGESDTLHLAVQMAISKTMNSYRKEKSKFMR